MPSKFTRTFIVSGLLGFASSLLGYTGIAMAEKIELSTSDWAPFTIANPDDGRHGFDYEVTSAAFATVGDEAVIKYYPWARALKLVEETKVYGVLTCSYKKTREPFVIFSDPISGDYNAVVTSINYEGPSLDSVTDLRKFKRIVGVIKFLSTDRMDELGIANQKVRSVESALKLIATDRADAAYFGNVNAQYIGNNKGLSDKLKFHRVDRDEYQPYHICFSRNKTGVESVIAQFNKGLKIIRDNGTYKNIHDRYR